MTNRWAEGDYVVETITSPQTCHIPGLVGTLGTAQGAGLVTCAKSAEHSPHFPAARPAADLDKLLGPDFRFPSSAELDAAAAKFPLYTHLKFLYDGYKGTPVAQNIHYRRVDIATSGGVKAVVLPGGLPGGGVYGYVPGESPRLLLSAGSVQLTRRSLWAEQQAAGRAWDRAEDERVRQNLTCAAETSGVSDFLEGIDNLGVSERTTVEALDAALREARGLPPREPATGPGDQRAATGRTITSWSAKSRANMILQLTRCDLSELTSGPALPGMVTLTLPGDWLSVAPSAKAATAAFRRFRERWSYEFGAPRWIWKREFQRRGAPHWHLWTVPPTGRRFRRWLSWTWTDSLRVRASCEHRACELAGDFIDDADAWRACVDQCRGSDCERCKSLLSGTGVDIAEGLRARDPKRLAIYFLKESGMVGGKAYQNEAPKEWAGQSIGRFWGIAGITRRAVTVELRNEITDAVWRALRGLLERRGGSRRVAQRVPRGARVDADGVLSPARFRTVHRRRRVQARAGWVAVNDGARFGAMLGWWVTMLEREWLGLPCGRRPDLLMRMRETARRREQRMKALGLR